MELLSKMHCCEILFYKDPQAFYKSHQANQEPEGKISIVSHTVSTNQLQLINSLFLRHVLTF